MSWTQHAGLHALLVGLGSCCCCVGCWCLSDRGRECVCCVQYRRDSHPSIAARSILRVGAEGCTTHGLKMGMCVCGELAQLHMCPASDWLASVVCSVCVCWDTCFASLAGLDLFCHRALGVCVGDTYGCGMLPSGVLQHYWAICGCRPVTGVAMTAQGLCHCSVCSIWEA